LEQLPLVPLDTLSGSPLGAAPPYRTSTVLREPSWSSSPCVPFWGRSLGAAPGELPWSSFPFISLQSCSGSPLGAAPPSPTCLSGSPLGAAHRTSTVLGEPPWSSSPLCTVLGELLWSSSQGAPLSSFPFISLQSCSGAPLEQLPLVPVDTLSGSPLGAAPPHRTSTVLSLGEPLGAAPSPLGTAPPCRT
jgi:hypothetical protein